MSTTFIIASFVAAVVAMVIGVGWYTLFGGVWMRLADVDESEAEGGSFTYILNFGILFAAALVLGILLKEAQISTMEGAVQVAFLGWLGFAATVTLQDVLWEDKSAKLYLFSNLQTLLSFVAIGVTLAVFLV